MTPKTQFKIIGGVVATIIGLVVCFNLLGWVTVQGNEAYVRQHWKSGVLRAVNTDGSPKFEDVYRDGTHFFNRFFWDIYRYDIGRQKLTFDFQTTEQARAWNLEANEGAEYPRLQLAVGKEGGQQVFLGGSMVYRIGYRVVDGVPMFAPDLLAQLHISGNGKNYQDVILKRIWQEVVTKIATPQEALDIYSGQGFETFRQAVDDALKSHPVLSSVGIVIESTIMYPVHLDPAYEKEIAEKQLAVQTKLKEKELQLAAEARALKVEAEKQSEVVAAAQAAEAKKQAQNKKAEADRYTAEQEAEAERFRQEQTAVGVLALKKAEAEGQRQLTEAMYGGTAGARRYKVEFGDVQAQALKGMLAGVSVITDKALMQIMNDPSVGAVKVTVPAGDD